MELQGTIAVVTGASSGMGQACVEALSARGVNVVSWDITPPPMHSKAVHHIACNVALEESTEQAILETIASVGVPRISIQCAGIAPARKMVGKDGVMPLSDFKKVIDVNLIGTFNVMRVVAAAMCDLSLSGEERGILINTASVAAFEGQIGQLAYSASKGGVVAMTLPAARELAQHAIRVNTIAPGLISTPMLLGMPEAVQLSLAASVTFPKRLGHPEEFAKLVIHLIENSYINGEVIRLDGAIRMQAR